MASFIGSVVLKTSDNTRASAFWRGALGYVPQTGNPDFLMPPEEEPPNMGGVQGAGMHLHLDQDDKTHLDLWVEDVDALEAEVARLQELGATRVDWTYNEGAQHVVLADTEGNLFCVCA